MRARRHGEDVVQLLERALLRLGHAEEDHHQRGQVERGVEDEGAERGEGAQQARERDGEHGRPEEAGRHRPGHADLAVREREHFRRVGEGHGALARRVEGCEEEDEKGDQAEVRAVVLRDEEAEARGQERPGHLREGEEEQGAPAVGIDCPDGGPGEDEVDEAEAEGGEQGLQGPGAGFDEDGRGVEGYDVDAAHLLGEHDSEGGEGGAADAWDGEELDESGDVVAFADDVCFFLDLGVDVVQITGGLEGCVPEPAEGAEGVGVAALLDVPSRGFGAEVDSDHEWYGGDEC